LALIRQGRGFEAHELFEDLWREADPGERDFCQGLVHVAVSLHLERRGSLTGMRSQLGKAKRRLAPYAPAHRGVDVAAVVAWCDRSLEAGGCDGNPPV
jgi:predicted metal-dependent hydrolase